MLFALLFISNNQLQRLLHLHSFLQLKQRRSAERTSRALESYLFTLLPVFTSNTSTMLFRSLLLFAFTSLSVAVAVPPNMSDDSMRRAAAAACDNLCNRSGKMTQPTKTHLQRPKLNKCADQNRNNCTLCMMNKIANSAAPCPTFDNRRQGERGCGHVEQSSRGGLSGTL